jgi:hypothetical protein
MVRMASFDAPLTLRTLLAGFAALVGLTALPAGASPTRMNGQVACDSPIPRAPVTQERVGMSIPARLQNSDVGAGGGWCDALVRVRPQL